jgi:hypothetical protein
MDATDDKAALTRRDRGVLASLLGTVKHVVAAVETGEDVSGADLVEALACWASENKVTPAEVDRLEEALAE